MRQRTITAVFFATAMIGGIYGGQYTFFVLFALITAGCAWELAGLLFVEEERFVILRRVVCMVPALLVYLSVGSNALGVFIIEPTIPLLPILALLFAGWAMMELFLAGKNPFGNVGFYLLTLAYIGIPLALVTVIAFRPPGECIVGAEGISRYAPHRVFGLLWLIWTNDTMAYLIGSRMGRTKLFERISPKKTWEGTIGGGIFAIAMAWLLSLYISDYSQAEWLALGIVAAVFGTLGDLIESMLKRSLGVKDSGALLPGHGGLLDRFDAFLFALPFAWLAVWLF